MVDVAVEDGDGDGDEGEREGVLGVWMDGSMGTNCM